jgi:PTS system mannose-specific IIB component
VIVLVRIDNRLIHGQILEAWVPRLHVRRLVVADDEAAASPLAQAAMALCLPPGVLAEVVPVSGVSYEALAASPEPTLLLFREVAALERAVDAGLRPELARKVNLNNVHHCPGRRPVTPSVFLTERELAGVRALAAAGFEVEARAVPSEAPVGPEELAHQYAAAAEKR